MSHGRTHETIPGSQEKFSVVEDQAVDKEVRTTIREHQPVEKQYVRETRPVGEVQHQGRQEVIGQDTRHVGTEGTHGMTGHSHGTTGTGMTGQTGTTAGDYGEEGHKKGMMEKIKEKLPGTQENKQAKAEKGAY